jgi:hypothetical protein
MIARKFADYGTSNIEAKGKQRREELTKEATAKFFSGRDEKVLARKTRFRN